jgi:hypothetical protein
MFGDQYRRYRAQVSMLIPMPGRTFQSYTADDARPSRPEPVREVH